MYPPVCLPFQGQDFSGLTGSVYGWGQTEQGVFSDSLGHTQVPIVDFDKCQERMGEFLSSSTDFVLCAGGQGNSVNQGDSGSPLTVNGTLAGIVSHGVREAYQQNGADFYDMYADVSKHIGWLNSTILTHGGMSSCGYTLAIVPSNETAVLVVGGLVEEQEVSLSAELYGNKTSIIPDLPEDRYGHATLHWRGNLVVCGGRTKEHSPTNTCILLAPSSHLWENQTVGNTRGQRMQAQVLKLSQGTFLLGSSSEDANTDNLLTSEFLPDTSDTWQEGPALPTAAIAATAGYPQQPGRP